MASTIAIRELPFKRDQLTELPRSKRQPISHRFEKHQYAYTNIWIWPDGKVTIITRFVNGKKLDGDHFSCIARLLDADKNVIATTVQSAGLNARGLKSKDSTASVASRCLLTSKEVKSIKFATFEYKRPNKRNDKAFWRNVVSAAKILMGSGARKVGDFYVRNVD